MKYLVYIIGEPGSGKSTLLATLLNKGIERDRPFAHIQHPNGIELGAQRAQFSGTDALPMNVQPTVIEWMKGQPEGTILIGEGDRLANDGFFLAAKKMGYELMLYHLWVSPEMGEERRQARGSNQNKSWIGGRITKVKNLAAKWHPERLDGRKTTAELVLRLKKNAIIERLCAP